MGGFSGAGRKAALACGSGAVGYGVSSVLVGTISPAAITWESFEQFAADYNALPTLVVLTPPFVVTLVFPLLMLAVFASASGDRRPWALLALVSAGIYTAVLGSAYWLQLTFVPWNILRGTTAGVEPWVAWNPAGFFWVFETFGYFAMGMSCLFAGLSFEASELPRRLRRGLFAMGALGVAFLVVALKDLIFEMTGFYANDVAETLATIWALSLVFAWVILFGFVAFAFSKWFRLAPESV
jgi:hypothetical protein